MNDSSCTHPHKPAFDPGLLDRPIYAFLLEESHITNQATLPQRNLIWLMNHVFGPEGWDNDYEPAQITSDQIESHNSDKRRRAVTAQCICRVRVHTPHGTIVREGVGAHTAFVDADSYNNAQAVNSAIKGAATNSFKRTCAHIGRLFGSEISEMNHGRLIENDRKHCEYEQRRYSRWWSAIRDSATNGATPTNDDSEPPDPGARNSSIYRHVLHHEPTLNEWANAQYKETRSLIEAKDIHQ